jgi:Ca-activated chloride channel family protein
MTPDPKPESRPSGRQHGDHLQYLLTAYLFGDLSAAGKAEVEGHLKDCARCRQELAELRGTLALTEEVILSEKKEYVFDDRRRARVLAGARQARHGFLARMGLTSLPRFSFRLTSVAALLLVVLTACFMTLVNMVSCGGGYKPAMESRDVTVTCSLEKAPEANASLGQYPADSPASEADEGQMPTQAPLSRVSKGAIVTHEEVEVADHNETMEDAASDIPLKQGVEKELAETKLPANDLARRGKSGKYVNVSGRWIEEKKSEPQSESKPVSVHLAKKNVKGGATPQERPTEPAAPATPPPPPAKPGLQTVDALTENRYGPNVKVPDVVVNNVGPARFDGQLSLATNTAKLDDAKKTADVSRERGLSSEDDAAGFIYRSGEIKPDTAATFTMGKESGRNHEFFNPNGPGNQPAQPQGQDRDKKAPGHEVSDEDFEMAQDKALSPDDPQYGFTFSITNKAMKRIADQGGTAGRAIQPQAEELRREMEDRREAQLTKKNEIILKQQQAVQVDRGKAALEPVGTINPGIRDEIAQGAPEAKEDWTVARGAGRLRVEEKKPQAGDVSKEKELNKALESFQGDLDTSTSMANGRSQAVDKININAGDNLAENLDKLTSIVGPPEKADEGRVADAVGALGLLNDKVREQDADEKASRQAESIVVMDGRGSASAKGGGEGVPLVPKPLREALGESLQRTKEKSAFTGMVKGKDGRTHIVDFDAEDPEAALEEMKKQHAVGWWDGDSAKDKTQDTLSKELWQSKSADLTTAVITDYEVSGDSTRKVPTATHLLGRELSEKRDEKNALNDLVAQQTLEVYDFRDLTDQKGDFPAPRIPERELARMRSQQQQETAGEPDRAERAQAEKDTQIRRLQEDTAAAQAREQQLLQQQKQQTADGSKVTTKTGKLTIGGLLQVWYQDKDGNRVLDQDATRQLQQQQALAQNQKQAETLSELVRRNEGLQQQGEQKARTDQFQERLKQLEEGDRVRIQEQVADLGAAMKEADNYTRKAEQTEGELHGGQGEVGRDQIIGDKLDNLRQAELRYRRVKEVLNYMPPNFDMPNERRAVDEGLEKTKKAIAAAEEELSFSRRQEASRIAEDQGLRETLLFKQRVGKLTEETQNLMNKGEYRSAEKLAIRVLQLDPLNKDAETLKRQARKQQHAAENLGELNEHYKEAVIQTWEQGDYNHIPYGDLLVYPANWDEISKRPERMAIGKKVDVEQWKTDIKKKLQRKVSFEFVDTPLDEAVNYLRSLTNVTIILDPKVKESGSPTVNLRANDMSLDLALGWMLRTADLDYSFRDKSIYVSRKENLAQDVELRIYDVSDLTLNIQDMPGPNLEVQQTNVADQQVAKDGLSCADLAGLIREKLFPNEFDPASGGSIEERSGRLVIKARPEVHERINAFLNTLRGPDPDRSERLVRACRFFQADNKRLDVDEFLRRPASIPAPFPTDEGLDEDAFIEKYGIRPFVDASRDHLSTFGLDVDTASYTRTRALLQQGQLPPADAVRTEEFVNYFKQEYTVPGNETFGVFVNGMPAPFAGPNMDLVKIGIKSRDPRPEERKPAALTFVVDVSGSMARADKSGRERVDLIRAALKALVEALQPEDSVCLVTFSDQARLALPRTQARFASRIVDALDRLEPGGATNVEAGLEMGYRMADEAYSGEAINRVIFCSDGVANVGAEGPEQMLKLVKTFAGRGIDLNAIGFGMGKYNDRVLQELADRGNGSYHFVNTPEEAQKIFREQLPPNLDTLARDAKAQMDFDPAVVKRYRLLGYEKRKIADADFRNDKIDAGEVAHSTLVTTLYEIERQPGAHGSLGKIFLRWKDAALPTRPVVERNYPLSEGLIASTRESADANLRFLACVAEFAELLRGSRWAQDGTYAAVLKELGKLPPDFRVKPEWDEVRKLVWQAHVLSMKEWLSELKH